MLECFVETFFFYCHDPFPSLLGKSQESKPRLLLTVKPTTNMHEGIQAMDLGVAREQQQAIRVALRAERHRQQDTPARDLKARLH
jgi:hypothetical protein